MKKILMLLCLVLQINAQNINLPNNIVGYNKQPTSPLFGDVHTILTSSYRGGSQLGDIIVEVYDPKQRISEIITHDASPIVETGEMYNLSHKQYYSYQNSDIYPNFIRSFENSGKPTVKVQYKYDEESHLLEQSLYSPVDKLSSVDTYVYDEKKHEVTVNSKYFYGERTILSKTLLQYNDIGQWTKRIIYDSTGSVKDSVSFEYDKTGLLTKEINCCDRNFFQEYKYKFDNKGNWIERKESYSQKNNEGKLETSESMITYRVISYYKE